MAQGPAFTLPGALILGLIFDCTLDIEQNQIVVGFNMGTKLVGMQAHLLLYGLLAHALGPYEEEVEKSKPY